MAAGADGLRDPWRWRSAGIGLGARAAARRSPRQWRPRCSPGPTAPPRCEGRAQRQPPPSRRDGVRDDPVTQEVSGATNPSSALRATSGTGQDNHLASWIGSPSRRLRAHGVVGAGVQQRMQLAGAADDARECSETNANLQKQRARGFRRVVDVLSAETSRVPARFMGEKCLQLSSGTTAKLKTLCSHVTRGALSAGASRVPALRPGARSRVPGRGAHDARYRAPRRGANGRGCRPCAQRPGKEAVTAFSVSPSLFRDRAGRPENAGLGDACLGRLRRRGRRA